MTDLLPSLLACSRTRIFFSSQLQFGSSWEILLLVLAASNTVESPLVRFSKEEFCFTYHTFLDFLPLTFAIPFLFLCPDLSFSCWLSDLVDIISVTGCRGSRVHLKNLRILKTIDHIGISCLPLRVILSAIASPARGDVSACVDLILSGPLVVPTGWRCGHPLGSRDPNTASCPIFGNWRFFKTLVSENKL